MNKKSIFFFFAAAIFMLLLFYCLWRQSVPDPEIYEYVYPVRKDIVRTSRLNGHIGSRYQVSVFPNTSGVLTRLSVRNGERVRKGEEIAMLDVSPQIDVTEEYITNEQNARISLEQAQRDEKRAKGLFEKGAISAREYEKAANAFTMAEKALALATSRIRTNRSISVITAPIDGIICNLKLVAGAAVSNQTPICGIFDPEMMIFIGRADETDVDDMEEGMAMTVIPGADKNARIPARIEYISEKGEDFGGIAGFEIRAEILDNDIMHLRIGYSANAEVEVERRKDVLSVEEYCVYYDPQPFVWVLSSNPKALKRQKWDKVYVTTGVSDGVSVEISGNISENDIIRGYKK